MNSNKLDKLLKGSAYLLLVSLLVLNIFGTYLPDKATLEYKVIENLNVTERKIIVITVNDEMFHIVWVSTNQSQFQAVIWEKYDLQVGHPIKLTWQYIKLDWFLLSWEVL